MVVRVRRARRIASTAAAQIAAHQGQVAGLDRDVGARSHRQPEIGLGEGGGIVDAVADHGDHSAFTLQTCDRVDLVARQHFGDHLCDSDLVGDGAGRGGVVAGQQDRAQSEVRAARQ